MSSFAREQEMTAQVSIKWHTEGKQVAYGARCLVGDYACGSCIDEAGAGCNGIARVNVRRVAFTNGSGDAALSPGTGCTFAEGCGRYDRDRDGGEFQRGEKSCEASPDDDGI
jgi:hypothetical protein